MLNWLFYAVPARLKIAYAVGLVLNMIVIPEYVLQIRLNILGEFTNFLVFDLLFYVFAKNIDVNKEE
jgi:hypothetical protein